MYQQDTRGTETVTLTKNQLQAILELITQMGGIAIDSNRGARASKPVTAWGETERHIPTHVQNILEVKPALITPDPKRNILQNKQSYRSGSRTSSSSRLIERKQLQWEKERAEAAKNDYWYQKFESDGDAIKSLTKSSSGSSFRMASPSPYTLCSSSASPLSTPSTPRPRKESLPSPPQTAPPRASTTIPGSPGRDFRRYARGKTASDPNLWEEKRLKVLEYQAALEAQKKEKELRLREELEKQRKEEELLEKRLREQQERMQAEYDEEQNRIKNKREDSERKRQAVIAAIERTPSLKKCRPSSQPALPTYESLDSEPHQSPQTIVAVHPLRSEVVEEERVQAKRTKGRDVSVQTDYNLLFQWLYDLKERKNFKRMLAKANRSGSVSFPVNYNDSSSSSVRSSPSPSPPPPPLRPLPKDVPIKSQQLKGDKAGVVKKGNQIRSRLQWNLNPESDSGRSKQESPRIKESKDWTNKKIQEMKKKHLENQRNYSTRAKAKHRFDERKEKTKTADHKLTAVLDANEFFRKGEYHSSLTSSPSPDTLRNRRSLETPCPWRSDSPPVPAVRRRLSEITPIACNGECLLPDINGANGSPTNLTCKVRPVPRKKWQSQEVFSLNSLSGSNSNCDIVSNDEAL